MVDSSEPRNATRRVALFAERDDAVRLLGEFEAGGDATARELRNVIGGPTFDPGGLRVALRDGRLVGAALIQPMAGGVAFLWPPRLAAGEPEPTGWALIEDCLNWAFDQRARLVQACVDPSDDIASSRLAHASFRFLAEIEYRIATTGDWADVEQNGADPLDFLSVSRGVAVEAVGRVIECTYRDSRDCPMLDGLRGIDEVLDGYRATGVYRPDWWLIAVRNDDVVGCLLMADHPASDQVELMYMGIVPEHRGRGLARGLVIHAHRLAREAGRSKIVLAVDRANDAARAVYRSAGFESWTQRGVWICERGGRPRDGEPRGDGAEQTGTEETGADGTSQLTKPG